MQLVTSANTVWPTAAAAPSVAYAQLGDLVEMLIHPKGSAFATCGFCQTLNREGAARCRACGGSFLPPDDEDRPEAGEEAAGEAATLDGQPIRRREFSDLPALRTVLLLVLVPPMLMFMGFGAWNELRASLGGAGQVALPTRSSIDTVFSVPRPGSLSPRADAPQAGAAQARAEAPVHAEREGRAAGPASVVAAAEADSEGQKERAAPARLPRPVPAHQAVRAAQGNPLAACSGYSFIARAVCVNKSCAEPQAAQHAQCRQANRQRRIDESRRNPVLMG